ncbi:hypothetical protein H2248_007975 [Termitomyces sp. 'cryptogamus']|nr:hypothetical protein H2248_007975 [Termitomyces sp. 'cryptogamus']
MKSGTIRPSSTRGTLQTEEYKHITVPTRVGKRKQSINRLCGINSKVKDSHASSNGKISIPESDEQENSQPLDFDTFMPSPTQLLDVFGPENAPHFFLARQDPQKMKCNKVRRIQLMKMGERRKRKRKKRFCPDTTITLLP